MERFTSRIGTRSMVPPYSVFRPSGVKATKDIQKCESIGCKLAAIMWVNRGGVDQEEEFK